MRFFPTIALCGALVAVPALAGCSSDTTAPHNPPAAADVSGLDWAQGALPAARATGETGTCFTQPFQLQSGSAQVGRAKYTFVSSTPADLGNGLMDSALVAVVCDDGDGRSIEVFPVLPDVSGPRVIVADTGTRSMTIGTALDRSAGGEVNARPHPTFATVDGISTEVNVIARYSGPDGQALVGSAMFTIDAAAGTYRARPVGG